MILSCLVFMGEPTMEFTAWAGEYEHKLFPAFAQLVKDTVSVYDA